jgi:glycosyltransferase involved in cell wall biosynthesis
MAAGVPVIATSVGGVPQIIRDGETGLLVNSASVAELESAVLRLLANAGFAKKLALAGQSWITANFSSQKMARTYADIYRALWLSAPGVEEIEHARGRPVRP